jgi:hypothetical protein
MASIANIGSVNGFTVNLASGGIGTVTYSFPVSPTGVGTTPSNVAGTVAIGAVNLTTVENVGQPGNTNLGTFVLPVNAIGTSPFTGQAIAYGAQATYTVGGTVATLGSSASTAGNVIFATSDYGYSTAGVDVITDFQTGIDQIRISSSLSYGATVTPAAPGTFTAVAGLGTALGTLTNNFIYDTTTGILYFNPDITAAVPVVDPTTPTLVTGGTVIVGNGAAVPPGTAIVGFSSENGAFVQGGAAFDLTYTFGTIADAKSVGVNAEVPFLQVLNNGAPVTGLSYSTDIIIF